MREELRFIIGENSRMLFFLLGVAIIFAFEGEKSSYPD